MSLNVIILPPFTFRVRG